MAAVVIGDDHAETTGFWQIEAESWMPENVDPTLAVPEWPQFMRGCIHYRQSLDRQLPDSPGVDMPFHKAD